MEKFSQWRDKGTGISPFMPEPKPSNPFFTAVKAVVFVFKFPVFVLLLGAYWVSSSAFILSIALKLFMGFSRFEVSVEGLKKSNTAGINQERPKINELIISNYVSPLDGFIFATISQLRWSKIVILIPDEEGETSMLSVWSLFFHALNIPGKDAKSSQKLKNLSSLKGMAVLYLPEGTPSNNRAILPFYKLKNFAGASDFVVKTLVLKLKPRYLTTPLPTTSSLGYLFNLLTNFDKNTSIIAKIYCHDPSKKDKEPDLDRAKYCFQVSQLHSVSDDLRISSKLKFFDYYSTYDNDKPKKD
ncbi:Piso0_005788 [Millerozyma farinosa CBS 7064]|uniref:Piso0_005788 protein n=1 Tax=Pichia sorbitophila (strain ATCC MYA-4447 / BCRC 22081 / CBS 7064 / NBRC 10061 / NRRL Y-12695) TaxID=559304 RepID=G8Y2X7_PICSO|nr:Piso0_005788 [Millerozyma farinosa CBS 7064]